MNKGTEKAKQKKSHTEIEQERRSKEAACYKELLSFIPTKKKLPKLSILEHISSFMQEKEKLNLLNDGKSNNTFDQEFNQLMLEAYKGFIVVVDCVTGIVAYVTENIENILQYRNDEWINHSFYKFMHRNDVQRVQNQLSSNESGRSSTVIQSKTGALRSKFDNDRTDNLMNRRGFLCRMNKNADSDYVTVHVTGYIQSNEEANNDETLHQYFLATVRVFEGLKKTPELKNEFKFCTRHDNTGRITFMDLEFLNFLGYKTDEVLGIHVKKLCIAEDSQPLNEMIEKLRDTTSDTLSLKLHFRKKTNEIITFETTAYNFLNAYNNQFEFIVAEHKLDCIAPTYDPSINELLEAKHLSVVDPDTTKNLMQLLDNEIKLCTADNGIQNSLLMINSEEYVTSVDVDDIVNDNFEELFNQS